MRKNILDTKSVCRWLLALFAMLALLITQAAFQAQVPVGAQGNEQTKEAESRNWKIEVVDRGVGDVGAMVSLALDGNNRPHMAYYDYVFEDLRYAYRDDAGWHVQVVAGEGLVGTSPSLALDSLGRPHISYTDYSLKALRYASWNGSQWTFQTVENNGSTDLYSSLRLDTSDRPHISYLDQDNLALKYARWNGSSWEIQTLQNVTTMYTQTSLVLDEANNPHISFCNDYEGLNLARWNGSSWDFDLVDPAGTGLDDIYFEMERDALALDESSNPMIVYNWEKWVWISFDLWIKTADQIRLARWTGADWNIQMVANSREIHNLSLALDAAGNPHISYVNTWLRPVLNVIYWTGSQWLRSRVDMADILHTSLALDSQGFHHIGYYNRGISGLKYAYGKP